MLAGTFAWTPPPLQHESRQVPIRPASPEPHPREPRRASFTPHPVVRSYQKPRQASRRETGTHGRPVQAAMQMGDGADLLIPPPLPRRTPTGNDPGAARAAVTCAPPKIKASDKLHKCPTRRLQKLLNGS